MDSFAVTILTSALVATVVGAVINAWLEGRKQQSAARLDALTAAVALEGFAIKCADKISDHDLAVRSAGHAGSFLGSTPELPKITVIAGFLRPKKASVANQLIIFPQEVEQAEQQIDFWWEVTGDIGVSRNAAVEQVAKVGLKASDLAINLRQAFNLPARELTFGVYNIRNSLMKAIKESEDA